MKKYSFKEIIRRVKIQKFYDSRLYFRICELFMHHNGLLYNMTERKSPTSLVPTVRTDSLQLELSPPPVTTLRVVPKEIIKDGTLVAAAILTHNFTDSW